jgi:acetylornithine deacetylase
MHLISTNPMQEPDWLNRAFDMTVQRLCKLIETPSCSREEDAAAALFEQWLTDDGITYKRKGNNLWAANREFNPSKPTVLLNSHLDTIKPAKGYSRDPFAAALEAGKLYGLGSNDAGGPLLCLYEVFKNFYHREHMGMNLIFAATAEEEISGRNGVESIINRFENIELAIVGEPTQMNLATAEKGLLVLDCTVRGISGHAARNEGLNAIYEAVKAIEWFRSYRFPKQSEMLGDVKMAVTTIEAGTQHNVIPSECRFTVDIRCTDTYTHEELLAIIGKEVSCEIIPRSMRLKSSAISMEHPIVKIASKYGCWPFGSPTLSDQALMPFPSVKIGPGSSARSHQSDEFIYLDELKEGIRIYHQLLNELLTDETLGEKPNKYSR